jgi:hypothetical protein
MRVAVVVFALVAANCTLSDAVSQTDDKPSPSAYETNKKGFEELPTDMESWRRVSGIPKNKQLAPQSPWSFGKDGVLTYAGGQAPEMLLFTAGKTKTNGIFHVEWRYKKAPAKRTATGGPVVRAKLDGTLFHEAIAGNDNGGFFTGLTLVKEKPGPVPANKQKGPNRIKPAGEWNLYEITFQGKTLSLFNNGFITAEWPLCDVDKGYIGVRGDGYPIEFRNMKFKRLR